MYSAAAPYTAGNRFVFGGFSGAGNCEGILGKASDRPRSGASLTRVPKRSAFPSEARSQAELGNEGKWSFEAVVKGATGILPVLSRQHWRDASATRLARRQGRPTRLLEVDRPLGQDVDLPVEAA